VTCDDFQELCRRLESMESRDKIMKRKVDVKLWETQRNGDQKQTEMIFRLWGRYYCRELYSYFHSVPCWCNVFFTTSHYHRPSQSSSHFGHMHHVCRCDVWVKNRPNKIRGTDRRNKRHKTHHLNWPLVCLVIQSTDQFSTHSYNAVITELLDVHF